jgi:hypothetical protein
MSYSWTYQQESYATIWELITSNPNLCFHVKNNNLNLKAVGQHMLWKLWPISMLFFRYYRIFLIPKNYNFYAKQKMTTKQISKYWFKKKCNLGTQTKQPLLFLRLLQL